MTALIEGETPQKWQDLESNVARILEECGYDVEVQKEVQLARGNVDIDVWADDHSSPPNVIAVECKLWSTPVPKNHVHSFRTVIGDSGANTGLVVSSAGFQEGAVDAAAYSNVRLMNWENFQAMFTERWYRGHMAPQLFKEADSLVQYTEPINSRIFRKAEALQKARLERFKSLRERYFVFSLGSMPLYTEISGRADGLVPPDLPLRDTMTAGSVDRFPDAVLDAVALRPLLEVLTQTYRAAIAEFDQVFDERA